MFEQIVDENKGLIAGQKLEDQHSNLLLNLSQMYYKDSLNDDFEQDHAFLKAFACFVERLPDNAFGFRNGRREIVSEEVR